MENAVWIIIIFLALNLALIILNYFALQKAKKHAKGEVLNKNIFKIKFYIQVLFAFFGLITFTIGVLSYSSFFNIRDKLKDELINQITEKNEAQMIHADSIFTEMSKFKNTLIVNELVKNDSINMVRLSKLEQKISAANSLPIKGQYVISNFRTESPSVGSITILFDTLGIKNKTFSTPPAVFIQPRGNYSAQIVETTTEYFKLKIVNSQERYVDMDLLIFIK